MQIDSSNSSFVTHGGPTSGKTLEFSMVTNNESRIVHSPTNHQTRTMFPKALMRDIFPGGNSTDFRVKDTSLDAGPDLRHSPLRNVFS